MAVFQLTAVTQNSLVRVLTNSSSSKPFVSMLTYFCVCYFAQHGFNLTESNSKAFFGFTYGRFSKRDCNAFSSTQCSLLRRTHCFSLSSPSFATSHDFFLLICSFTSRTINRSIGKKISMAFRSNSVLCCQDGTFNCVCSIISI